MFTLSDIAQKIGLKLNTLRYWLKKNNEDVENNYYDFNLTDLTKRVKIRKKTVSSKNICRSYEQIMILDSEKFEDEFGKYIDFIASSKRKKRLENISWTEAAIDCYTCKMNCDKCFNKEICSKIISPSGEPPMKNVVKKLLLSLGKPQMKQLYS